MENECTSYNFGLFAIFLPKVRKYEYIILCIKSQQDWFNLAHLPILPPPVTAKQRRVIIPGDQPKQWIQMAMEADGIVSDQLQSLREKVVCSKLVVFVCVDNTAR